MRPYSVPLLSLTLIVFTGSAWPRAALAQPPASAAEATKRPDVVYVPTPPEVVEGMLDLAKVTKNDVVYDLGSGDGRIVIAAAKRGARAIGVEVDPERLTEARANAKAAGVDVTFLSQDLFETDLPEATVVTLYLLPSLNRKLMPKLQTELKSGSRVVSHSFDMGDWKADDTRTIDGRWVYLWIITKP
jgi:SAM-dependent methyltransferase